MPKNTTLAAVRPTKPNKDFPLFPHRSGRWCKKVRGAFHYFGSWRTDPNGAAAIVRWTREKDFILAGIKPPPANAPPELTVMQLANQFLAAKRHRVDTRELSTRTFADYYSTCERVIEVFGKLAVVRTMTPQDFAKLREVIASTRGPVGIGNEINRVRILFNFAFTEELIEKPVRFGEEFKQPRKAVLRRERQSKPPRMFESADLRRLIKAAGPQLKAMILLGVNCGFGNHDVACLPQSALDLASGWCDFPRPKTAVPRRCALWPETASAIKAAIAARPKPREGVPDGLVFLTRQGRPWVRHATRIDDDGTFHEARIDGVAGEFAKLLRAEGLKREGISFYTLRHVLETIGGGCRDQVALDRVMGHADGTMSDHYREAIEDSRLRAVADHVRAWLWPRMEQAAKNRKVNEKRTPKRRAQGNARGKAKRYDDERGIG